MKKKLMLTVNVIAYNHEKWIAQCLDSILAQKTSFNFVIRIFEDCSTDNTADICRQYKEKYPDKIELYLSNVNLGAKKNALRSYENIQSPYYIFIESDDYICNNKRFQMQVDALEKHKDCSFCCGITVEIDSTSSDFYLDEKELYVFNKRLKTKNNLIFTSSQSDIKRKNKNFHCTPILEQGIYTQSWVIKYYLKHIFSYLVSRMVRTDCIDINQSEHFFLADNTQMFELLQRGNMLYFREIFGVSRHTGEGIISGKKSYEKMKFVWDALYKYNSYTNNKFCKNLLYLLSNAAIYYCSYEQPLLDTQRSQSKLKKIKRYFIPRFILDIFLIPRNLIRLLRNNILSQKSLMRGNDKFRIFR